MKKVTSTQRRPPVAQPYARKFGLDFFKETPDLSSIRRDFDYIKEALVVTEAEVNRAQISLANFQ